MKEEWKKSKATEAAEHAQWYCLHPCLQEKIQQYLFRMKQISLSTH